MKVKSKYLEDGSVFIPIPNKFLKKLGLVEGDKINIEAKDDAIYITKIK